MALYLGSEKLKFVLDGVTYHLNLHTSRPEITSLDTMRVTTIDVLSVPELDVMPVLCAN